LPVLRSETLSRILSGNRGSVQTVYRVIYTGDIQELSSS